MKTKNKLAFIVVVMGIISLSLLLRLDRLRKVEGNPLPIRKLWAIQSIDTMKYSRDMAGQMLDDPKFDSLIEKQVTLIAKTGATHIALGVPYDEQFLPIMHRWVKMARKYNLKVWFRGNLSGWEGWFEYPRISRAEHLKGIKTFIINNGALFEDGDLFSSCPECENGGAGDPRQTGDVIAYRQFLIDETAAVRLAFKQIDKSIPANLNSMNADVAKLVMDRDTTAKLGGFVVLDHYVSTPEKLVADIHQIANNTGGKIILGEYGAPIPDIHGNMTEDDQAKWINKSLNLLVKEKSVVGINYWTGFGGSTKLWNDDYSDRLAVDVVTRLFSPPQVTGRVVTILGIPIGDASIIVGGREVTSDTSGRFSIAKSESEDKMTIARDGYKTSIISSSDAQLFTLEPDSVLVWLESFLFGK